MIKTYKTAWTTLAVAALMAVSAPAATYTIDKAHTTIGFAVRHMMVSNVKGNFGEFDGTIEFDEQNPTALKASATIQAASINTANEKRDDHLRNDDFFDVANHPTITFETTRVEGELPNLTLVGNLTIRGVTKEISLPVELNGPVNNPWSQTIIGISGTTTINRQDFGVKWSNTLDGGGLVVADEVKLLIELEAIKQ